MILNFTWRPKTGQYLSGESLYLNKIRVGEYSWNIARSQDDQDADKWAGCVLLPSQNNNYVFASDIDEIKLEVELRVMDWFHEAQCNIFENEELMK